MYQEIDFPKQYSHDNGHPMGIMEKFLRHGHDVEGKVILANTLVLRSKKPNHRTSCEKGNGAAHEEAPHAAHVHQKEPR